MAGLLASLPKPLTHNNHWFIRSETDPSMYSSHTNWPRISIVIPSYNQGAFIEDTIRSILLQNYPNLELIIIDGKSTDNTVATIRKYESWIKYWISESDNGQSDAINKGLSHCTGTIFNWLNSDDFLEKNAFFTIAEVFIGKNPRVVSARTNIISKGAIIGIIPAVKIFNNLHETIKECGFNQPALYYDMNTLRQLKGVDPVFHYAMDLDLWNRFLFKFGQNEVVMINSVVANFRIHDESKTNIQEQNETSEFSTDIDGMFYSYSKLIKKDTVFLKLFSVDEKFLSHKPYSDIPVTSVLEFFNNYYYLIFKSKLYRWRLKKAIILMGAIHYKFLITNLLNDFRIVKLLPKQLRRKNDQ